MDETVVCPHPEPWNKGKLVGQKAPGRSASGSSCFAECEISLYSTLVSTASCALAISSG